MPSAVRQPVDSICNSECRRQRNGTGCRSYEGSGIHCVRRNGTSMDSAGTSTALVAFFKASTALGLVAAFSKASTGLVESEVSPTLSSKG
jgi:hypothetical protein